MYTSVFGIFIKQTTIYSSRDILIWLKTASTEHRVQKMHLLINIQDDTVAVADPAK